MQLNHTFTGLNVADGLRRWWLVLAIIAGVAGCNSGGGGGGTAAAATAAGSTATSVVLAGSVGDGPVTGATVSVYASDGSLLGTMVTNSLASFNSTVKARGRDYPLRLVVSGGIDLVTGLAPDFEMVSLLAHPSDKQANINPFTTFIVKLAESLPGGLSSDNLGTAQRIVQQRLGFGLDPAVVPSPFTTQIDESNVANLVKASEALGELVRRTRDLTGLGADRVVTALAADLTDGYLDGLGASGTNARVAAVANVAASQVLVETLSNSLRVGGVIASGVMDQSIQSTRPGISGSQLTGSVMITGQVLAQARAAVAAAKVLDSSAAVQDVADRIDSLSANSTASDTSSVLPASSTDTLDTAVNLAPVASDSQLQQVNVAASTGTVLVNTAPLISGTPATSVTASSAYLFQPIATDADGDALTFSITNKPAWAIFNTSSGELAGTPFNSDAGSYNDIVISVTDGVDTASLGAFSIDVSSTSGRFTLSWTAPVSRADGSPLLLSEIGGYRIHYGSAPGSYPNIVDVSDGTATSATISNVPAGSYFVVMSTYDTAGLESGLSGEVPKTAQ